MNYSHALSVINENYYELLVLNELSEPVTVVSVNNFPYWLSVEAQDGVNKNGHPVLKLNVKKEDGMPVLVHSLLSLYGKPIGKVVG
jgi:hypothetical protein